MRKRLTNREKELFLLLQKYDGEKKTLAFFADEMGIKRQQATYLLKCIEGKGYITRQIYKLK